MELFIGLDVSQESTHLSVVDSTGKELWQGKCLTAPDAIAERVKRETRRGRLVRIGLETGPMST